jgi:hypothetical protein
MVPGFFWVLDTVILFLSRLTKLRAIEIAAIQTKSAQADFFLVPRLRLGTKTGRLRLPLHEKIFLVFLVPRLRLGTKTGRLRLPLHEKIFLVFLVPSLRLGTKTGRLRLPLHEKINGLQLITPATL